MEIWRGHVLWRVYVHPHTHPHTQLKKSGIPHTHTHTQSMRGFPVKTETGSDNTHGDEFICHHYVSEMNGIYVKLFKIYFPVVINAIYVTLIGFLNFLSLSAI